MNGPNVSGDETTIALDSRAHRDHRIVIRIGKRKLFRIGRHDPDRLLGLFGEEISDRQIAGTTFAAEVATDGNRVDANIRRRHADSFR